MNHIVALSGGTLSTSVLIDYLEKDCRVLAVTFDYGFNKNEVNASRQIAKQLLPCCGTEYLQHFVVKVPKQFREQLITNQSIYSNSFVVNSLMSQIQKLYKQSHTTPIVLLSTEKDFISLSKHLENITVLQQCFLQVVFDSTTSQEQYIQATKNKLIKRGFDDNYVNELYNNCR